MSKSKKTISEDNVNKLLHGKKISNEVFVIYPNEEDYCKMVCKDENIKIGEIVNHRSIGKCLIIDVMALNFKVKTSDGIEEKMFKISDYYKYFE